MVLTNHLALKFNETTQYLHEPCLRIRLQDTTNDVKVSGNIITYFCIVMNVKYS